MPLCVQISTQLEEGAANHRQKQFLAFVQNSKDAVKFVANATLPPPGGAVVGLAMEVASVAIQAVFNNKNCCQLAKRMADVVHSVWLHHVELEKAKNLEAPLLRLQVTLLAYDLWYGHVNI